MSNYQQMQQQLVQAVVNAASAKKAVTNDTRAASGGKMMPGLVCLLDALPYYGNPAWEAVHRGALANLLAVNLPNNGIAAQGSDFGFGYSTSYSYSGPYSGYRDAFYNGVGQSGPAAAVASLAASVNSGLNAGWWGNYGVAVLTDAVRQTLGFSLDTGKLSGDLGSFHGAFLQALTASVLAIYQDGFSPTAQALKAITSTGQTAQALAELTDALTQQEFTAAVNEALSMGGDSTNAATWFLYNLWVTLKALGAGDVDGVIRQCQAGGLTVPAEVGAGSWWTGGYASWYAALNGADVAPQAGSTLSASMPEKATTYFSGSGYPSILNTTASNGYSNSLCYWGPLNWYTPPSSSCFGGETGVLMADGSVRPIAEVHVGDEVHSSLGPRRVVLVEAPGRRGRTLYRVNDLKVLATSAHPFRTLEGAGPARVAADPWALLDQVPTAVGGGVGVLRPGVVLSGLDAQGPRDVPVTEVTAEAGPGGDEERVYDLVLEGWAQGQASYYVGGPELFVAADPETVNPLYEMPLTVAFVSALEASVDGCRQHVDDPVHALSRHVEALSVRELAGPSFRAAMANPDVALPDIPKPEFYLREGEWDAHASMLEAHLVRHHARRLRRELHAGWRAGPGHPSADDHLAICVHDLELVGEHAVDKGAAVEVVLFLRGLLPEDVMAAVPLAPSDQPRWHLVADTVVDLGSAPAEGRVTALLGELRVAGVRRGTFHASVTDTSMKGSAREHFLFGVRGEVVGRIAVEQRRASVSALAVEQQLAGDWTRRRRMAMAVALGRRLGRQLTTRVQL
jgi:hypothetical protein